MATKIVTKNSSTASAVPTASDLVQGELAVNVADKRLFTENNAGAIVELGTNPSGNVTFQDNGKAIFGAGSDLQIYHDGSNSYIADYGTGDLKIRSNKIRMEAPDSQNMIIVTEDAGVQAFYNGTERLSVNNTGIDVTGTATISTDLNVGGAVKGNAGTRAISVGTAGSVAGGVQLWAATNQQSFLQFGDEAGTAANHYRGYMAYNHANDSMSLGTSGSTRATIDSSGNVGIGTSNPDTSLHVTTPSGTKTELNLAQTAVTNYRLSIPASTDALTFVYGANTERMRIDSSGNVGIGKTPNTNFSGYVLQLNGGSQTFMSFGNSTAGTTLSDGLVIGCDSNGADIYQREAQPLRFHTSNTEAMRIDSSGNVGIGTTSPSNKMSITGFNEMTLGFPAVSGGASRSGIKPTVTGAGAGQLEFLVGGDNNNEATTVGMAIDSSGNVGIGTSSPSNKLHVHNTAGDSFIRMSGGGSLGENYGGFVRGWGVSGSGGNLDLGVIDNNAFRTAINVQSQGNEVRFSTVGSERMRIDSAGNLLVGKTATGIATVGAELKATGELLATVNSDACAFLNRKTSDGDIAVFRKDGTTVGSIGVGNTNRLYIGTGDTGIMFDSSNDAFYPWSPSSNSGRDNAIDVGYPSLRFDDIYATNGTIQTSDRNEKQDIAELSDAEQRVAVACKGLLRKFRWKDSVAEKGDDARIHFGIIAQDLQAAFEAEGLDAGDYAMFISTTWTDEETNEEKTRMGVRYSELLAFIISAI